MEEMFNQRLRTIKAVNSHIHIKMTGLARCFRKRRIW